MKIWEIVYISTILESNYSVVIQTLHLSFLFWKIVPCRDLNPGPPGEKQMTYQCATMLLSQQQACIKLKIYNLFQIFRTSPFPVQRENGTNNFVASVATSNDVLLTKCPLKCRPKDHQDWEYCWQSYRIL